MAAVCRTCTSPDRPAIEAALVSGQSIRGVALRYGLSKGSVSAHFKHHVSPALAGIVETKRTRTLIDRAEQLIGETESILQAAKESGRAQLALSAIRELRESIKLLGLASGELRPEGQVQIAVVNLVENQEYLQVKERLLLALAAFPEARAAAATALLAEPTVTVSSRQANLRS